MLPQSDYNVIASGNNGYTASAGYNLVTGLGTPVANVLVPDLIAYQGPGTTYSGATVAPMQSSGLVNTGSSDSGSMDVFSVFDALPTKGALNGHAQPQPRVVLQVNRDFGATRTGTAESPGFGCGPGSGRPPRRQLAPDLHRRPGVRATLGHEAAREVGKLAARLPKGWMAVLMSPAGMCLDDGMAIHQCE